MSDFEQFARDHGTALTRLSFALCGDHQRAEDAAQTALERVYVRWHRIDDPASYARQVVVNATRDGWRGFGRRERVGAVTDTRTTNPYALVDDQDALSRALLQLPHGQRAVLVLRYWEDLTEQATAEALGCSVGTVKSQASRAMTRLRALLPVHSEETR